MSQGVAQYRAANPNLRATIFGAYGFVGRYVTGLLGKKASLPYNTCFLLHAQWSDSSQLLDLQLAMVFNVLFLGEVMIWNGVI